MNVKISVPDTRTAATPSEKVMATAAAAAPSIPSWSAVSRPRRVSARWPQTGMTNVRTTAIAASASPI